MSSSQEPSAGSGQSRTTAAGSTPWTWAKGTPLRSFVHTETGSAIALFIAAVGALIWANGSAAGYESFWSTHFLVQLGRFRIEAGLRQWVNSGLMTFFFFVVGLEARREFDIGELRERRRVVLPLLAGLGGMVVPVVIYLAFNARSTAAHGWGVAMSTDTAFALGILALVGSQFPDRLRIFMLTVVVVDDLVALVVIALAYTDRIAWTPLCAAAFIFAVVIAIRALGVHRGVAYGLLGVAMWVALFESGVDPVVVGLAMGLLTLAYPASRYDLERASETFRLFREQPTPELARQATAGVQTALSPNERLQQIYHPWTSGLIVPLFAVANTGIPLSRDFLERAVQSPITLGIFVGYVVGKPVGVAGTSWLVTRVSGGLLRPPVGWASVLTGGAISGVGFTVSLLIAFLAFGGEQLQEAKAGILGAALAASILTGLVSASMKFLPASRRATLLLGTSSALIDLAVEVDARRDHIRGPAEAPVTLVEYGDMECPYCGQAEGAIRELLAETGDVRYVWRHLPLTDVHPNAQLAAEASEAASTQGEFWKMHDLLLDNQEALRVVDLIRHAGAIGLDVERFEQDLRRHSGAPRVAADVESADLSGVSGTPTFFVNGRRHHGAFDIESLSAAVSAARARADIASRWPKSTTQ